MYTSNAGFDDEPSLFDEMDFAGTPEDYLDGDDDSEIVATLPPKSFGNDDSWTLDDFEDLLSGF